MPRPIFDYSVVVELFQFETKTMLTLWHGFYQCHCGISASDECWV